MTLDVPASLLRKYDKPGPRYTSYPTVPSWSSDYGEVEYRRALNELADRPGVELCLYLHVPFCAKRCHYCGCNAVTGRSRDAADQYLDAVALEVAIVTDILGSARRVRQVHWGGGTPNFLRDNQLERAVDLLQRSFDLDATVEISLEADPRVGTPEQARRLRELGFNRISLGVQDFDPYVQKAIGRNQSAERTRRFYADCRAAGFNSVNLDLVYGLPGQTRESFARTLEVLLELDPDRVACFSYAHVPWVRKNQEQVDTSRLPSPAEKFALFLQAIDTLTAAGYTWIGMDHFARQDDELAVAHRERRLHRNFMGYTTRPADDQLALGMSGISELAGNFAQNDADLMAYQNALRDGRLATVRGHRLNPDDRLRQRAIAHLMCNLELPFALTSELAGSPGAAGLDALFADELERLEPLARDGLLVFEPDRLRVTELGRFFIRNICMELDAYLDPQAGKPIFSRTV